jgi:hypothetical protein
MSYLLPKNVQSSRVETLHEEIGEGELQFPLPGSYYPKGLGFLATTFETLAPEFVRNAMQSLTHIFWSRLGDSHMSNPYPSFNLDAKWAKQRLVQSFQSGPDRHADSLSPPITKTAPVANDHKEAANRPSLSQELSRLLTGLRDLARNATAPKRSGWTKRDMSTFSFSLTLLLLGTIAGTKTNNSVFWLLIGPAPLAAGFTVLTFFRQGFSRRSPFAVFGKGDDYRPARRQNKHTI